MTDHYRYDETQFHVSLFPGGVPVEITCLADIPSQVRRSIDRWHRKAGCLGVVEFVCAGQVRNDHPNMIRVITRAARAENIEKTP